MTGQFRSILFFVAILVSLGSSACGSDPDQDDSKKKAAVQLPTNLSVAITI